MAPALFHYYLLQIAGTIHKTGSFTINPYSCEQSKINQSRTMRSNVDRAMRQLMDPSRKLRIDVTGDRRYSVGLDLGFLENTSRNDMG
ncbi:hypothetical protein LOAG_00134 [Loa loa]|uniref:Uncharacterized protein n=1 Tax=Loa loa TaxID=7209 RepID=A0A1S0UCI4_LOALO|nr:hypothetical protein LOAG_00134 [Loa loa]EFO28357.1 hypothetical protein LOAG_00134 [Loa loa]